MYVEIIDKGECFSTTMEFIDGVYANKEEWEKHNFYPKNGMVGEVVKRTPSSYIIKIAEGIYVPMTRRGIREITFQQYQARLDANVCNGMDEDQKRINDEYEAIAAIAGYDWRSLPNFREHFKIDIIKNFEKLTCDGKYSIFLPDLELSATMYALDMCLEYQEKSGRKLDPHTCRNIITQVNDVYQNLFQPHFDIDSRNRVLQQVENQRNDIDIRETVDDYYKRINQRYAWKS